MQEALSCPICKEIFVAPMALPCIHSFCSLCIRQHLNVRLECPVCFMLTKGVCDLRKNTTLETIVEIFVAQAQDTNQVLPKQASQPADIGDSSGNDSSIVECPLCSKFIEFALINQHMDSGCKLQTKPQRRPKALVPYDMLKDAKIRSLLHEEQLSTKGPRSAIIKRHHEWVLLYNSNLDSKHPRTDSDLRRTLISNEANYSTAPSLKTPRGHDIDPTVELAVSNHVEKYQGDFDQMIQSIKKRQKRKSSESNV